MFAMMQEQHQEHLSAIRENNADAMKTANAAMAEIAKNMQTMMATIPGMNKPEVENDKNNDTRTKEVDHGTSRDTLKGTKRCAQIAKGWCTTSRKDDSNWKQIKERGEKIGNK